MSDFHYTGDDVLDIMEKYAPNRNSSIEKLIILHLGLDESGTAYRVLEFGAGRGEFIKRLICRKNLELIAVDTDLSYINRLSEHVKAYSSIDEVPGELDCIYLIDVLEHLEDDKYFLKKFYDKLKKNGKLFIYVPARMELYSAFDKKIGHFRRYTKAELKTKVLEVGFNVNVIRYHELLGYIASYMNKMSSKSPDLSINSVKVYDKVLVPTTNFIERFIHVPIGKSIYLSAVKE